MEDLSTFIWLGIAVVWFLTRFIGRAVRKGSGKKPAPKRPAAPRPAVTRAAPAAPEEDQGRFTGNRGGQAPPPIVPR